MFLKFELNLSWRTTPLEPSTALLYKTASSHLLSAGSGLHRYTAVSTKFVGQKSVPTMPIGIMGNGSLALLGCGELEVHGV